MAGRIYIGMSHTRAQKYAAVCGVFFNRFMFPKLDNYFTSFLKNEVYDHLS